jgi:hypothetical protein
MITKDNLASVMDALTEEQIETAINSDGDDVALYVNGYGSVYLEPFDYNEDNEDDIFSTGGLICDKDTFLQLFKDSESVNPFLIELI